MRRLLNLSVAQKLLVSACLSIALLGVLVMRNDAGLAAVAVQDDASRESARADAALRDARQALTGAALATRVALTAQTPEAVDQAAREQEQGHDQARRLLSAGAPAGQPAAQEPLRLLERYHGLVAELAQLRRRLLEERDRNLLPLLAAYGERLDGLRPLLEAAPLEAAAREALYTRLATLRAALGTLRGAILRYLLQEDEAQLAGVRQLLAELAAQRAGLDGEWAAGGAALAREAAPLGAMTDRLAGLLQGVSDLNQRRQALGREALPLRLTIDRQLEALSADLAAAAQRSQERLHESLLSLRRSGQLTGAVVALLLLLSAWAMGRLVGAPMRRLAAALVRITAGETRLQVPGTGRRDEIGAIATAVEGLRNHVTEAFTQRQIIEQLPVAVVTADPRNDFRINYMNAQMRSLLQNQLAKLLPCKPEEVLGQSFDIFHRDRAHQRALMADGSRLPYRTRITAGGEVMDLRVTALRDQAGGYIGPLLVWSIVTEQARLADSFEADVGSVVQSLVTRAAELQEAARRLSANARQSEEEAGMVAGAASRADADVQAVAAASEEMAASIVEITRRVSEAASVAQQAVAEAHATDATMRSLAESAARIGDVVKLIGDIAGQTNLLALNATIEAARAGEAGKGFAVVASEVKNLAGQTARATEEISSQIAEMQGATDRAVEAIRGIGATVERTNGIATAIAAAVEEQGAATQEIARAASQVAQATGTVSQRIGGVRAAAAETGQSAGGMLEAARELSGQATALRTRSDSFLKEVRA